MDGWKGDKEKKSFDVPKQRRLKSGVSPASELPARRKMEDRRGVTSSREEEGDGSELDSSMQKQHRQQRGGNTDVLRQTPLDWAEDLAAGGVEPVEARRPINCAVGVATAWTTAGSIAGGDLATGLLAVRLVQAHSLIQQVAR